MPFFRQLALLIALACLASQPALAGSSLTPAQERDVRALIEQTLKEKPEIILEAIELYRARQEAAEEARAQAALGANREALERDADTPISGNPDGDVTIVEFFDYRCGFCKRVLPVLQDFLNKDSNVRLVLKELPILGPQSVVASKAALAAWKIDKTKYMPFHTTLMSHKGQLTVEKIMDLASEHGLDPDALKKAMRDPWVDKTIARNRALAQSLGIGGTPAFVIGDTLIPGALNGQALEQAVTAARKR